MACRRGDPVTVLLVTSEYPPAQCGGIGVFYHALAGHLAATGVQTHVLTDAPPCVGDSEVMDAGVTVHRVPLPERRADRLRVGRWRFDARLITRARARTAAVVRLASRVEPDVIETHDWSAPLWASSAKPFLVRLHGATAVLAQTRGERPPRLQAFLERRLASRAMHLVAVSEWIREQTARAFAIRPARIDVVPNGVDTELFRYGGAARAEQIVYAGTLRESKGVPELLEALELVLRARPTACASLAGGPDAWFQLSPRIRARIERLQAVAPKRLRLLGWVSQPELAALYRRAAVCVFPSRGEAFGLACVEAMSSGAAVIASPLGAGGEIVEHGRTGLLADPRQPADLAAAIDSLLAHPERARTLGEAGRRRVEASFSIGRTAEATIALYERLLRTERTWPATRVA